VKGGRKTLPESIHGDSYKQESMLIYSAMSEGVTMEKKNDNYENSLKGNRESSKAPKKAIRGTYRTGGRVKNKNGSGARYLQTRQKRKAVIPV